MVKQVMAKVNTDILGTGEIKLTGMDDFNSYYCCTYYSGQESLRRNIAALIVNRRFQDAILTCHLKNDRMISVYFQGKPFSITVIQIYAPTTNAKEAEAEWFYDDLQHQKMILFIIEDWNAKVGSQEIPRVTGKFDPGVQNEAGQRLIEFC